MPNAPKHAWFSTSSDRMVVLLFPRVIATNELQAATDAIFEFFEKNPTQKPWIVDLSNLSEISATHRKILADNERRITPMTKLHVTRLAYVVEKPLMRAALTAFHWIVRPPYPHRIFAEREPAEAWILSSGLDLGMRSP